MTGLLPTPNLWQIFFASVQILFSFYSTHAVDNSVLDAERLIHDMHLLNLCFVHDCFGGQ